MKIKLEKLSEAPKPLHINHIPVGKVVEGIFIEEPVVGKPFYVGYGYRTSVVEEVMADNTFRTKNSIYKWTEIHEEINTNPSLN